MFERGRKGKAAFFSLILFTIFLLPLFLNALDPDKSLRQYIRKVWTSKNGLPGNSIQAVAQTKNSYLWFGSQQGLCRFNGYDFKIFDEFNTKEILQSYINSLFPSKEGGLWIGTWGGGLNYLNNGKFEVYTDQNGLSSNFITAILEDPDGTLWIGTENHGLNIFKDGKFTRLNTSKAPQINQINYIILDSKNDKWIATSNGLFKYSNGKFIPFPSHYGLPDVNISAILEDHLGQLWIGTDGEGLFRHSETRLEKMSFPGTPSPNVILNLLEDEEGNLWIGTRKGLVRYHSGKLKIFSPESGLLNNEVLDLFEDREGSLWIGTSNGLHQLKDQNVIVIDTEHGLNVDMVWAVYEDRDQNLWIGTNGGGVSKWINGEIVNYTQRNGLPSDVVRSIYQDSQGYMWIGTIKGLVRMDSNGQELRIFNKHDGLSNEIIRATFHDRKGNFWVGTSNGLFRMEKGKFRLFPLSKEAIQIAILCITEDQNGTLWIGAHMGVFTIQKENVKFYGDNTNLGRNMVLDILADSSEEIWLGTNSGLVRWADGQFVRYQRKDGFPDNTIYSVTIDSKNNLWMSSNQGIFFLNRNKLFDFTPNLGILLEPTFYNQTDGLKSMECNGGSNSSSFLSQKGILWFPNMIGAVGIDPEYPSGVLSSPPVKIEEILVDETPVNPQEKLELRPGTRRIEFRYAALTYYSPEKTRFKTKLENYEEDWSDAGSKHSIYYHKLPPGSYTFHVTASNASGVWSAPGTSFSFSQKPYFYQSWWFFLICISTVIILALGLVQLRVRQLVRKEKKLKELVSKRTAELQEANNKLEKLTILDDVTQIFNRRRFLQLYNYEWKRSIRTGGSLSIVMIDIDFFKLYNDTYGHIEGDNCLQKVAQTLKSTSQRFSDMVARFGGEEFVIVLAETDVRGAALIAEKARRSIETLKIPNKLSPISNYITISAGHATMIPQPDSNPEILIKAADEALYLSKENGRNRVTQIDPAKIKIPTPQFSAK